MTRRPQRAAGTAIGGSALHTDAMGRTGVRYGRRWGIGALAGFVALCLFASPTRGGEPGSPGHLFVSGYSSDNIVEFDENGQFVRVFATDITPGDYGACGLAFGPNGNLFVCSFMGNNIREYDGTTGAFVRDAIAGAEDHTTGWLRWPTRLLFMPDGRLLVCNRAGGSVLAYDAATFEWLETFAMGGPSPGGMDAPYGIALGSSGDVFVTASAPDFLNPEHTGQVLAYHPTTGRLARIVTTALNPSAHDVAFAANGNIWVLMFWGDGGFETTGKLVQLNPMTGDVVTTTEVLKPRGLLLAPSGNVLVAHLNEVLEFDGSSGQLIGTFASSSLLTNAEGLVFKPAPPVPLAAPTISGVSVAQHDGCQPMNGVIVTGINLDPVKTAIRLAKAGETSFFGAVTGGDGSSLTVDFNLDGGVIADGLWDVMVVNPDGQSATLTAAVNIKGCATVHEGNLLATAYRHRNSTIDGIIEYDGQTGDVLGWFAEDMTQTDENIGELWAAPGITIGPDGDVYVACARSFLGQNVPRFDGVTGQRVGDFVLAGSGGLMSPYGVTFGPNGNLFVVDRSPPPVRLSAVFEYDGLSGAFVRVVVERGDCGLVNGEELFFAEDNGHFFVTTEASGVIEFDEYGGCIGVVGDTASPAGDLIASASFSPHTGDFVVTRASSDSVVEYSRDSGTFLQTLVPSGSGGLYLACDGSATWGPNGSLFVTSFFPGEVLEFDGVSGDFVHSFASLETDEGVAHNFGLVFAAGPTACRGDLNCDGVISFADINAFVLALTAVTYCDGTGMNADINGNGSVGFDDINPFVALLTQNILPARCP